MSFTLSPTQIASYQQAGFLVLPGFKPAPELAAVRARAEEIVAAFEPGERFSIFSTHEQRRSADAYFLGSGDQIRCFFEEEAFDAAGQLRQAKALSINKIGHALHDRDPVFDTFSHGPALAGCGRSGAGATAVVAVDVHLQAARHWRRGGLAPGRHVF
jgi:phytanoyl-CoA hydroxylase